MINSRAKTEYRWKYSWLWIFISVWLMCCPFSAAVAAKQKNIDRQAAAIAYLTYIDDSWVVMQMDMDNSTARRLTDADYDIVRLSRASLPGKLLMNDNLGRLTFYNAGRSSREILEIGIQGMTDAVWSKDGKNVLFSLSIANSIDANDIWLVNVDDRKLHRLTKMKHMQHDPAWTADEKQVVFVSGAGGQNHDLYILDLASGGTTQLTAGQRYHFEPACSVNDEIAFSSNRTDDYEIWVCDLEGKRFEQITHSPGMDGQPTWSPDGKQIAFVSTRSGYPAIWIINRDGSNVHQISPEGMRCRGPVWSR